MEKQQKKKDIFFLLISCTKHIVGGSNYLNKFVEDKYESPISNFTENSLKSI